MKLFVFFILLTGICYGQEAVLLNGESLTIDELVAVCRYDREVKLDPSALEKVKTSHELLLVGAKNNLAIYGLNRGVGLNKDRKIFIGETLDPEIVEISRQFNRNLIYSHSTGVGTDMPQEFIRASMLVRLNMLLRGVSGIQPEAPLLLAEFLNRKIHPVMPSRGSIGEADIAILSHIALALMGEGEVFFLGQKISAKEALKAAGLKPIQPFAKDALSILSSNAYSTGLAALTLNDTRKLLDKIHLIYALSLEGLNGNIAPLLWEVQKVRPFCGQWEVAKKTRALLEGSYLWNLDPNRALQDPLSFRTATQVQGSCFDLCKTLEKQLSINLNSADDNPAVILDVSPNDRMGSQERSYYVKEGDLQGAVIPSGNFEPITWVINYEALGLILSHLSHNSAMRMVNLVDPHLTNLSRFLAPDDRAIAFGTIQKAFLALDTENRALANPVSMDFFPAAGNIEDHATNAPLVAQRVSKMIDNLIYISAMELMHAAQAIDLRKRQNPDLVLGKKTEEAFNEYRKVVPFLDKDRILNFDITSSYRFLKESF